MDFSPATFTQAPLVERAGGGSYDLLGGSRSGMKGATGGVKKKVIF
jgi:hypothetical protein